MGGKQTRNEQLVKQFFEGAGRKDRVMSFGFFFSFSIPRVIRIGISVFNLTE